MRGATVRASVRQALLRDGIDLRLHLCGTEQITGAYGGTAGQGRCQVLTPLFGGRLRCRALQGFLESFDEVSRSQERMQDRRHSPYKHRILPKGFQLKAQSGESRLQT